MFTVLTAITFCWCFIIYLYLNYILQKDEDEYTLKKRPHHQSTNCAMSASYPTYFVNYTNGLKIKRHPKHMLLSPKRPQGDITLLTDTHNARDVAPSCIERERSLWDDPPMETYGCPETFVNENVQSFEGKSWEQYLATRIQIEQKLEWIWDRKCVNYHVIVTSFEHHVAMRQMADRWERPGFRHEPKNLMGRRRESSRFTPPFRIVTFCYLIAWK